ncbi:MAG TPA: hypothetical protein VEJ39_04460 [Candidatus Acidoferrales bacterium]|nr:hypothetical protein [Candidatus Acidoferrales bacterium]
MKFRSAIGTAALLLIFGTAAQVYSQDQPAEKPDHQQDAKPPQDEKPPKDANPPKDAKPPKTQDETNPPKNDKQANSPKQDNKQAAAQSHSAQANGAGRIPDDKFKAHFGPDHKFKIGHPTVVNGAQRFQYSGYWFEFSEPWPAGWVYTDQFYIIFVDGAYYLCDPNYPGVQLAIIVVV